MRDDGQLNEDSLCPHGIYLYANRPRVVEDSGDSHQNLGEGHRTNSPSELPEGIKPVDSLTSDFRTLREYTSVILSPLLPLSVVMLHLP